MPLVCSSEFIIEFQPCIVVYWLLILDLSFVCKYLLLVDGLVCNGYVFLSILRCVGGGCKTVSLFDLFEQ